jgi:hypothetical protein
MDDLKCTKCGTGITETYQRGPSVSGTRCLSCGFTTLAKVCKTVGQLRTFIDGMGEDTYLVFGDDPACIKVEANFLGDKAKTEKIKVWKGEGR